MTLESMKMILWTGWMKCISHVTPIVTTSWRDEEEQNLWIKETLNGFKDNIKNGRTLLE